MNSSNSFWSVFEKIIEAPTPVVEEPPPPEDQLPTEPEGKTVLITRPSELEEPSDPALALDLETTGLNPRKDRIRLVSMADSSGKTWVIDTFHVDIKEVLPLLEGHTLVAHNASFDLGFLWEAGFKPSQPVVDTMILSRLLYAGEEDVEPLKKNRTSYALDAVAERELGIMMDKSEQKADWSAPLSLSMLSYAAQDVRVLLPLKTTLENKLKEAGLAAVATLESRVLPALIRLRQSGAPLDEAAWRQMAELYEHKAQEALQKLEAHADINWNSWQQVLEIFAEAGVELSDTKEGTLKRIDHPLAIDLLEYRQAHKLASTYGNNWLESVEGRRVYADWVQVGPATGRTACRNPNLQNVPRGSELRACFKAPPGRKLVIADYSQIELRIVAKVSGDKAMLEAYASAEDLHTKTAKSITGKQEITKADRTAAKAVGFGLLYGMEAKGLRDYAHNSYGVQMSLEEATKYRARFFEAYPALGKWHEEVKEQDPYEARTLLGRRRSELKSFREALNHPVQGTAADGQKLALALLWEGREECPHAFPILVVHDEIVIECDATRAEEAKAWLVSAMVDGMNSIVNATEPHVPIEVEPTIAESWAEKH